MKRNLKTKGTFLTLLLLLGIFCVSLILFGNTSAATVLPSAEAATFSATQKINGEYDSYYRLSPHNVTRHRYNDSDPTQQYYRADTFFSVHVGVGTVSTQYLDTTKEYRAQKLQITLKLTSVALEPWLTGGEQRLGLSRTELWRNDKLYASEYITEKPLDGSVLFSLSDIPSGSYQIVAYTSVSLYNLPNGSGGTYNKGVDFRHINFSSDIFVIDNESPVFSSEPNSLCQQAYIETTDNKDKIYIDGVSHGSNKITYSGNAGKHTYFAEDPAGNRTETKEFYIVKTAPKANITSKGASLTYGAYTNAAVTVTIPASSFYNSLDTITYTITMPGMAEMTQTLKSETTLDYFLIEGTYHLMITNAAGLFSIYSFTIDYVKPTGILSGVTDKGYTNTNVSFSWADPEATATLNGSSYTKNNIISAEGQYTLTLSDKAGNSTIYTFTIDKTAPSFSMYDTSAQIYDSATTNKNVYFTWNDSTATMTVNRNGSFYTNYYKNYYIYTEDYDETADIINESKIFFDKDSCVSYIIPIETAKVTTVLYNVGEYTVHNSDKNDAISGSTYKYYNDLVFVKESTLTSYIASRATNSTLCKNIVDHTIKSEGQYLVTLIDLAGNQTTRQFTILKTAPEGTLIGVENGGYTNSTVTFTWTTAATATLNGSTYNKDNPITTEGSHTIILKDTAGNSRTYTFTIDYTAPTGIFTGLTNTSYNLSNKTVRFSWTDPLAIATLNGENYVSGTAITAPGTHEIILTDKAGNSKPYTFTIDLTEPEGVLTGLTNETYNLSNTAVSFSWEETTATATLNGNNYSSGQSVDAEGQYSIVLRDLAGNSKTYSFTIDKTEPIGIFSGLTNEQYMLSNKTVSFSWIEVGATATLNGNNYSSGENISLAGNYSIILTDRAGNSKVYSFEITFDTPVGTIEGLTNEEYNLSNRDVVFSWVEFGATAKYQINDGSFTSITSGTSFSTAGNYLIIITNLAGNSKTYTFTIDKTAPTGTLTNVNTGGITNKDVKFSWTEYSARATLNGEPYINEAVITLSGTYIIILTDLAGNTREYTFIIKKTSPTGILYLNQNINDVLPNGGITSKDVYFTWPDQTATATLNNIPILQNTGIGEEGTYKIILTDLAGNKTEYTFTINKTYPKGTLNGVTHGDVTKETVTFVWSDNKATATLNGNPYIMGTSISSEGFYEIILTNEVNLSTHYTFTIDKTPPTGTLSGVMLGGVTKENVLFYWTEVGAIATLNGNSYQSNSLISAEGSYTIILTDKSGNKSTYNFEIDKTAPTGILTGVAHEGKTNGVVTFTWSETGANATLNNESYSKGQEIRAEGVYTIILTDLAGNSKIYTFSINLTAPTGYFIGSGYNTYNNIHYFNENMGFSWDANGAYAQYSINSGSFQTYIKGTTLSAEATYKLRLYDDVGNLTVYDFIIDKTPYLQNKTSIMNTYTCHITKWYESFSYALSNNKYIENIWYSFTNYDDALRYAINRERGIVETQIYQGGNIFCNYGNRYVDAIDISNPSSMIGQTFYIYKDIDNSNRLIAYFKESNLELAINKYATTSLKLYYLPRTPSLPFSGDAYIPAQEVYTNQIFIKDTSFRLPYTQSQGFLYINGVLSAYSSNLNPGINYIKEVDYAGNETIYTIFLDISAPLFEVYDNAGMIMTNYADALNSSLTLVYFDTQVRLYITDNYDENCLLTITFEGETSYIIGTYFELNKTGTYEYTIRDIAGNTKSGTIHLSLSAPVINLIENLSITQRLESFDISISKGASFVNIQNITVLFKGTDMTEYIEQIYDNIGTLIKESVYSYRFLSNGDYVITIVDNFGREVERRYTFIKEAPIGTLYLKDNSIFHNDGVTNQDVYFDWADQTCVAYYTLNGVEANYPKKQYLSTTGIYTIRLEDAGGNYSVYKFEIKKTSPTSGRLYYINEAGNEVDLANKAKTSNNVYFTYDKTNEPNATVKYSVKDSEKWAVYNGEAITKEGTYNFQLTDRAGNSTAYSFTIDKTPPLVTIKTTGNKLLNNNSVTNVGVSFIWEELNVYATLNKAAYASGTVIRTEGTYVLYIEDSCGNFANYYVTIDTTAPNAILEDVTNGGITNSNVSISWTEADIFVYLNNKLVTDENVLFAKKLIIFDDGAYEVKLSDLASNITTFTFTIDRALPAGTLTGVTNGGITKNNVRFTWTKVTATATLNGDPYSSNSLISAEGTYQILLTDKANNVSVYTFEIDKTAPVGTLNGVNNGGYINTAVTFTWSEDYLSATLNGVVYTKDAIIDYEAQHSIILSDRAGNSSTYTFTLDKTPPVGILSGVTNGGLTKNNVSFSWTELTATATLNGVAYTGSTIRDEGEYELILTDRAGNAMTYRFKIDKSNPVGTLNGLTNIDYNLSNASVNFTWTDSDAQATLNGSLYISGTSISEEGMYTIILKDAAGGTSSFVFEIDKTAPVGTFSGITNLDLMLSNTTVTFSWTETTATATLNGAAYTSLSSIKTAGTHTLVLTDRAGNSTAYSFEIDLTAPTGTLTGLTNTIYNLSNKTVSFSWNGEYFATCNSERYDNNFSISEEGKYTIVLTDKAGNSTAYSFEIDLTAPTGTLTGLTNTSYNLSNKTVSFSWTELNATATLNDNNYTSGQNIVVERNHIILLTDRAGNSTVYTFTIDKTAPLYYLYDVNDNFIDSQYNNTPVYISWTEEVLFATIDGYTYVKETVISDSGVYYFELCDLAGNLSYYQFSINTAAPYGLFSTSYTTHNNTLYFNTNVSFSWTILTHRATLNGEEYLSNAVIRNEGHYLLILTDREKNTTTYEFVIDKTAPNGVLYGLTNSSFGLSNGNVYLTWSEDNIYAYINGSSYVKNQTVSDQGSYSITLYDLAGNTVEYNFTIDKIAPVAELIGVADGGISNSSVRISWEESSLFVLLNDKEISNNYTVSANGYYTLILKDRAGNYSTYTFTIDKTAPIGTLIGVTNGGSTNTPVFFVWEGDYSAQLDGVDYARGEEITEEGQYVIVLISKAGTSTVYTFEIDLTAPTGTLTGVANEGYTRTNVSFNWIENGVTATLNGNPYTKQSNISAEGKHTLIITDKVGNSTTYTFTVDKTAPKGVFDGLTNEEYYLSNSTVYFNWYEDYITVTLNDEPYVTGTGITEEGSYKFVLTDLAGNTSTYIFTIDKTAPVGILVGVENNGKTNGTVSFSWEEPTAIAYLNSVKYLKNNQIQSSGYYWLELYDLAGNFSSYFFEIDKIPPVGVLEGLTNNTYNLSNNYVSFSWTEADAWATLDGAEYIVGTIITAEGSYIIELYDYLGNKATYTFTIDKTAPEGTFTGFSNSLYNFSKTTVNFSWVEVGATATLNGETYIKGNPVSIEGEYELTLTDRAGNSTVYTFTIDKTAPEGVLTGLTNEAYNLSNTEVSFRWEETTATATLNGNSYSSGQSIDAEGEYSIVLRDLAGNSKTYIFTIDKTAPIGTLTGATHGEITNKNVSLSWTELTATATLNGATYTGAIIRDEGEYELILTDRAGNSTAYSFTIDKTAPEGILTGLTNEAYNLSNTAVSFSWEETTATATLNGNSYSSGQSVDAEGEYSIVLRDLAGNSKTYVFTIDTTAPKGTLTGATHGETTNATVTFTWGESSATATLNGNNYTSGQKITIDGIHFIILTDRAGNSTAYTFTIDKTAPEGILTGLTNEAYNLSNTAVSFSWEETTATATLNGNNYSSGQSIDAEGEYSIVLRDLAGNSKTYVFTIDKTAPKGTLKGISNESLSLTNKVVSFSWTELTATATLNGNNYTSGQNIAVEGAYELILTDRAGNSTAHTFTIDLTAPEGVLTGLTNEAYGLSNTAVSFIWEETTAIATLNGNSYSSGQSIDAEGGYTIILSDLIGNSMIYVFTIDKTPPSFTGIENDSTTNKTVKITWTENNITATVSSSIEGENIVKDYNNGTLIKGNGTYTVILTDRAGNTTTVLFTIFADLPKVSVQTIDEGVIEDVKNNAYLSLTSGFYLDLPYTITVNGDEYVSGLEIKTPGKYDFVVEDDVGNIISFSIKITSTENNSSGNTGRIITILLIVLGIILGGLILLKIILSRFKKRKLVR